MQLTGKEVNRNNKISLGVTIFSFLVLLAFLIFKNIVGASHVITNENQVAFNIGIDGQAPNEMNPVKAISGMQSGKLETGTPKKEIAVSDDDINVFNNMTAELLEKFKANSGKATSPSNHENDAVMPATMAEKNTGITESNGNDPRLSFDLAKRHLVNMPEFASGTKEEGKVIVEIVVDKYGNVVEAAATGRGTNTNSSKLKAFATQMASATKFSPAPGAEDQRGFMTINFSFK